MKKMLLIFLATVLVIGSFHVTTYAYNQNQLDKVKTGWKLCNGFDLSNANLSGLNLKYVYLEGANLKRANLFNANLTCAHLKGADLRKAILRDAILTGADMAHVHLIGAIMPNGSVF